MTTTADQGQTTDSMSTQEKEKEIQTDHGPENQASQTKDHSKEEAQTDDNKPYSIFTPNDKRLILFCAGVCSFFSPISSMIYFPSLNQIAADLKVSNSQINLTITTYLIMQGLAPTFIGGLSDSSGRRPAYLICFVLYMIANLALALQSSYPALLALRCLQSAGSSATVALATSVAADLVTSSERGVYISYMSIAPKSGPSLGPIIGGLLGQYLGWHSVFWFLLITAAVVLVPMIFFFPETCRRVVDDGSVPPPKYYRCYMNEKVERRLAEEGVLVDYERRDELTRGRKLRFPNPLNTLRIVFMKESGFALGYIAIVFSAYYAANALIPSQFGGNYGFNEIQIALCYIPLGVGSAVAGFVRGKIIDHRFKHYAKKLGVSLEKNRRVDLIDFPIERARLEVALPTLATAAVCIIGFGWMVQYKVNLAGPLIFLFIIGFCVSASVNTVSVLLIDIFPGRPGAASAANNLCRCWLGAAATAFVEPLIHAIGIGWTTTFFGLLILVFSPMLFYIMVNGPKWRRATKEKEDRQEAERRGRDAC